jgi:hypothetical protein
LLNHLESAHIGTAKNCSWFSILAILVFMAIPAESQTIQSCKAGGGLTCNPPMRHIHACQDGRCQQCQNGIVKNDHLTSSEYSYIIRFDQPSMGLTGNVGVS